MRFNDPRGANDQRHVGEEIVGQGPRGDTLKCNACDGTGQRELRRGILDTCKLCSGGVIYAKPFLPGVGNY